MYNNPRWISIPPGTDQETPLCCISCGSNRKQVQILCEHVTVNIVFRMEENRSATIQPQIGNATGKPGRCGRGYEPGYLPGEEVRLQRVPATLSRT